MAYEWKYFSPNEQMLANHSSLPLTQLMDGELAVLKEKKGEFWTRIVEFFVETKITTVAMMPNEVANVNVRFIARFADAVVKEKYGDNAMQAMKELIDDSDVITKRVVDGMLAMQAKTEVKQ